MDRSMTVSAQSGAAAPMPAQDATEMERIIARLERQHGALVDLNGRATRFLDRVRPQPSDAGNAEVAGVSNPIGHLHRISVLQDAIEGELERMALLLTGIEDIG